MSDYIKATSGKVVFHLLLSDTVQVILLSLTVGAILGLALTA